MVGSALLLGLLVLVEVSVGWAAVVAPWARIHPASLVGALLLVLLSYGVRTVRVYRYFAPATTGDFAGSFRLMLVHNLFNNLLPMRSGEASFPILMRRTFGVPFGRSVPGLVYLRMLDLHFLIVLGMAVLLSDRGPAGWAAPVLVLPAPYVAFLLQERLRPRRRAPSTPWTRLAERAMVGLPGDAALFRSTWLWTAANWTVKLLVFAWILRAFAEMSFPAALLGGAAGELSSVLPVHGVAGAGTYEGGVSLGLLWAGVPPDAALTGAVNLHLFVLGASVLCGGVALLIPRRGSRAAPPGSPAAGEAGRAS